jgi:hypothetical protein
MHSCLCPQDPTDSDTPQIIGGAQPIRQRYYCTYYQNRRSLPRCNYYPARDTSEALV